MKLFLSQLLLVLVVLIPLSTAAETIYLKDGTSLTGKLKKVGTDEVVITTTIGDISVESAKILRVEGVPQGTQAVEAAPVKTYADWHVQQKNGLGFGPGIGSMPGIILFYDHNLSGTSQVHVQLDENAMSRTDILGDKLIKTQRTMLLTTYRQFVTGNSGFYFGGGGGYADSKFEYTASPWSSSAGYSYNSKLSGIFLLAEAGWQGIEGYYFHVGLQPAAYVTSNDNFDIANVPNVSNHRSVADEEHKSLKQLGQVSVGFGWYF